MQHNWHRMGSQTGISTGMVRSMLPGSKLITKNFKDTSVDVRLNLLFYVLITRDRGAD
jgi:hypothetical protein